MTGEKNDEFRSWKTNSVEIVELEVKGEGLGTWVLSKQDLNLEFKAISIKAEGNTKFKKQNPFTFIINDN